MGKYLHRNSLHYMTWDTFSSQSHKPKGIANWQTFIYCFHPKSYIFKVASTLVSLQVFSFLHQYQSTSTSWSSTHLSAMLYSGNNWHHHYITHLINFSFKILCTLYQSIYSAIWVTSVSEDTWICDPYSIQTSVYHNHFHWYYLIISNSPFLNFP
jgi:hypothetical protein